MAALYRNPDTGSILGSTGDEFLPDGKLAVGLNLNAFPANDVRRTYFLGITERDAEHGDGVTAYLDAQGARELATFFGYIAVELENGREHS